MRIIPLEYSHEEYERPVSLTDFLWTLAHSVVLIHVTVAPCTFSRHLTLYHTLTKTSTKRKGKNSFISAGSLS